MQNYPACKEFKETQRQHLDLWNTLSPTQYSINQLTWKQTTAGTYCVHERCVVENHLSAPTNSANPVHTQIPAEGKNFSFSKIMS